MKDLLVTWSRSPDRPAAFDAYFERWRLSGADRTPLAPDESFCLQTALAILARAPLLPAIKGASLAERWAEARRRWPLAFAPSPFDWWLPAGSHPSPGGPGNTEVLGKLEKLLSAVPTAPLQAEPADPLGQAYRRFYPPRWRQNLGEFYTPASLAQHIIAELAVETRAGEPHLLLDPSCGSGVFLAATLRRLRDRLGPDAAAEAVARGKIVGIDIHPLAVVAARLHVNLTVPHIHRHVDEGWSPPIVCADALADHPPPVADHLFHFVVGNPPYVRAARIPADRRRFLRDRFIAHRGAADLSVSFIERSIRWLAPGGQLRLVVSRKPFAADYGRALVELLHEECPGWALRPLDTSFEGALVDTALLAGQRRAGAAACGDAGPEGRKGQNRGQGRAPSPLAPPQGAWDGPAKGSCRHAPEGRLRLGVLVDLIARDAVPLGALGELRGGVMGFDYRQAVQLLTELGEGLVPSAANGQLAVVGAGHIRPFHAAWAAPIRLLGRWRSRLVLPAEVGSTPLPPAQSGHGTGDDCCGSGDAPSPGNPFAPAVLRFYRGQKILVRGIARRLTAAYDPHGIGFLVAVYGFRPARIDPYLVLGLLNSPVLDFYARALLAGQRIPRGSWRFPKSFLLQLPMPKNTTAEQADAVRELARHRHRDPWDEPARARPAPAKAASQTGGEADPARAEDEWTLALAAGALYGLPEAAVADIMEARRFLDGLP